MYLRRNNKIKGEVSLDEPLNVDWDGNELLLSDILGTENDEVYGHLEDEVNKNLLVHAMRQLSGRERGMVRDALRTCRMPRADPERGSRQDGDISVIYIQT